MHSDTKLIKACLAQDKVAWDMFVEKYSRLICHAIVITLKGCGTFLDILTSRFSEPK
jgi:hypothetical protein